MMKINLKLALILMMMNKQEPQLLKDLSLDELVFYYNRARAWHKLLTEDHPNIRFAVGTETDIDKIRVQILHDIHQLWLNMIRKIPASHILEIETLKKEMALPESKIDIAPGQRYEHKFTPGLIIEVHRTNERLWVCGQYLNNKYIMICNLSMQVITSNFTRLNP